MLHTKFPGNRPPVPEEKMFEGFFTIYGYGRHLGHVTIMLINFHFPISESLHVYKIRFKMAQ